MIPPKKLLPVGFFLAAFVASSCSAAPEFLGVMTSSEKTYVMLRDDAAKNSAWTTVGGNFGEYVVHSYDSKSETLSLKHADTVVAVKLKKSVIETATALALLESLAKNGDPLVASLLEQARSVAIQRNKTAAVLSEAEATANGQNNDRVTELRRRLEVDEAYLRFTTTRLFQQLWIGGSVANPPRFPTTTSPAPARN